MKLFRKIRQSLIKEGNLKRYLLYAIGEILLVMIGISLAFQVNTCKDNRINEKAEIRYYENIRDQIADDGRLIRDQIGFNTKYMAQFKYANEILESNDHTRMDTLGLIVSNITQYSDFDRQGNIYETMVNSGQVKLLRNYDIINGLRLLEEKYLYLNRMENIHYNAAMTYGAPAMISTIKLSNGQIQKANLIFNYEFQNLLLSVMHVMTEKDKVYNEALNEIEVVTKLIAEELENE
jgi:hypothetical protein